VCIDDPQPPRQKPSTNIADADWQAFLANLVEKDNDDEFTITW